jgi:hypothetical protein
MLGVAALGTGMLQVGVAGAATTTTVAVNYSSGFVVVADASNSATRIVVANGGNGTELLVTSVAQTVHGCSYLGATPFGYVSRCATPQGWIVSLGNGKDYFTGTANGTINVSSGSDPKTVEVGSVTRYVMLYGGPNSDTLTATQAGTPGTVIHGNGAIDVLRGTGVKGDTIQGGGGADAIYDKDGLGDHIECGGDKDHVERDAGGVDTLLGCQNASKF